MNALNVLVYDGTTPLPDIDGDLQRAEGLTVQQGYPGGRDLTLRLFVPRDPTRSWLVRQGLRLVVKSGVKTVFDGIISNIGTRLGARPGNIIEALGPWGDMLTRRKIQKYWADNRITEQAWHEYDGPYPKANVKRGDGALTITPKGDYAVDEVACRLRYTMPT